MSDTATGPSARAEFKHVKDDVSRLREDLASLAQSVLEAGKAGSQEARERLEVEARKRLEQLKSAASTAKAKGEQAVEGVETQIRERPIAAVLVAFGAGLILGKLLDRR